MREDQKDFEFANLHVGGTSTWHGMIRQNIILKLYPAKRSLNWIYRNQDMVGRFGHYKVYGSKYFLTF